MGRCRAMRRRGYRLAPASDTRQLGESSPANTGSAPPVSRTSSSSARPRPQLAAVELDRDRARRAAQDGRDRGAARAGARGQRLPHPALEDPRPHGASRRLRMNETLVRFGKQLAALDPGPDRAEVELLDPVAHLDHALRVADRDVLEGATPALPTPRCRARPRRPRGSRPRSSDARPISIATSPGRGDRRPDLTGLGQDRELVLVGPPGAAQVEHGLPGAVARELGLRAVGVEDPQLGHVAGRRPPGPAAGCRRSRPRSAGRRSAGSARRVSSQGSSWRSTIT